MRRAAGILKGGRETDHRLCAKHIKTAVSLGMPAAGAKKMHLSVHFLFLFK